MLEQLLQAILEQVKEPKADLEKNLRAVLSEMISRMDLVSQEEFIRQQNALKVAQANLQHLNAQLETLIAKVASLESNAAL
jgi:BMFP domain-containing protein YqiC